MQAKDEVSPRRPLWGLLRSIAQAGPFYLAALLLSLVAALPATAQYRASLQGTVADAQGAMIPGAQLVLTDQETNRTLTVTSDQTGHFSFNQLAPSSYTLVVTRDGFNKKVLSNIAIRAEQANTLNVALEVWGPRPRR